VLGTATVSAAHDSDDAFVELTSFATPLRVLRVDTATGATTPWDSVGRDIALPHVRVSMLYATSKDGTRVPMFVVEREGAKRDGSGAAVIYGYGGFNIAQTPAFSTRTLMSVERGAAWVVALLRGGGELGEEWHRAGMLDRKQNVFDDLYACAETLAKEGVARKGRIGVVGGSNGGLLTAVAVTQRPELFRAALSLVPLADMLRFQRYRIGALWTVEYGDPADAAAFAWLHAYSPYHHVVDGVRYPSVLLTTAESDSRVDPMHARKMAARMQAAQADASHPILLKVESRAGHGAGKPVAKLVDQVADELTFLFRELEMA
jgi:prolyl oligopeptidase